MEESCASCPEDVDGIGERGVEESCAFCPGGVEESCASCPEGVGGIGERGVEESCASCPGGVGGIGREVWRRVVLLVRKMLMVLVREV